MSAPDPAARPAAPTDTKTDTETDRTDAWGVQQVYLDTDDEPQRSPDATVDVLRRVIGEPPADLEERAPLVTRPGRALPAGLGRVEVTCEDGTTRTLTDVVPEDLPLGYHRMRADDGPERSLIVSPGRCWLPDRPRWGWTVQLYAARSASSWSVGDLRDLRRLREWTEGLGGGFLLVSPLHAVAPVVPQETSPYLPATRRFRNPVYLSVEEVPGFEPADLDGVAVPPGGARAPVDRDAAWTAKLTVLRRVFDRTGPGPAYAEWRAAAGDGVREFATWCVLAERHGPSWHDWPADLRDPGSPAVARAVREHADDVEFHTWLQWLLEAQLTAATGSLTVLQDLPIGFSGDGADAWAWQDVLAEGVRVGAPPDMMNSQGQDWGSPPLVPWRLRAADYVPFIESIRATIAGAGGLRIDHVMGLFRLWWVPRGESPREGAYVRYPAADLLDIVALESHRAQAVVVGEDLGVVEPGVRETLAELGILSYKVFWFEDEEPADWPRAALAAVTTHDLPTVAGLWSGSDAEDQLASTAMTREEVEAGREELLARLRRRGLAADATPAEAVTSAYEQLAAAPSLLLSVALEDAVATERRPNVPGTVERDNWRVPLPIDLEELVASDQAAALARTVAGHQA